MTLDGKPWEQLPDESAKAHAAFCLYRDQPRETRTLAETGRLTLLQPGGQRHIKLLNRWHAAHRWAERARAWDAEMDRIRAQAFADEVANTARRHAQIAAQNMNVLMAPAVELSKRITEKRLNLMRIPDAALLRLVQQSAPAVKALVEVERLSRGMATNVNSTSSVDDTSTPQGKTIADAVRAMFAAEPERPAVDTSADVVEPPAELAAPDDAKE